MSFLLASRSLSVSWRSSSGISFVPGGWPGTLAAFLAAIVSSFYFASSLYFYRYFGTLPKFLLSAGSALALGLGGGILGGRFCLRIFAGADSKAPLASSSGSLPFAIEALVSS